MAHFALLDKNNIVIDVIVVGNENILDKDGKFRDISKHINDLDPTHLNFEIYAPPV